MKKQCLKTWIPFLLAILVLAATWPAAAQVTLIPAGSVWKYLDDGTDQGTAWQASAFVDSSWLSGPAPLGYGDANGVFPATTNNYGLDPNNKFITTYYRQTFNVVNAAGITNLQALLKRDDGAVVYLNGTEVFRSNMPGGDITYTNLAATTAADDGSAFNSSSLNPALLVNGNNTVAVEVHQAAANSSDLFFDFALVANPRPTIAINSPTNGQIIASANVTIVGTATPGGQSITLVEAFAGGTKVGESTNGNFNILWQNVVPTDYVLTARITDSSGLVATSAPVNVTVQAPPATILVPRGSVWKYHNLGTDLGSAWTQLGYNDSGWPGSGPGPLGDNLEGAVQNCATVIDIGPSGARYPQVYYRKSFTVSGVGAYQGLIVRVNDDDVAAVYLNGALVVNDGVVNPGVFAFDGAAARGGADELAYREFTISTASLLNGPNVLAVENHQFNATSSDLQFDLELEGVVDTEVPTASYDPQPGAALIGLTLINVVFSEGVKGVNASDLTINGEGAASVITNNNNDYSFHFPQPATGTVQVAWVPAHGITDLSPSANPFGGGNWIYRLDTNVSTVANFVISEFMADNSTGIRDEDFSHSDWIEILNAGTLQSFLDGWYLTDTPTNLTKWQFPVGMPPVSANGYLVVWASSKDRTNPLAPLHTNFKLSKVAGGYLALVDSHGNVVSSFNSYPAQQADISYGRDSTSFDLVGFNVTPTPGKPNSTSGPGFVADPVFSLDTGIYTNASLTLTISNPAGIGTIRFTTNATVPATNSPIYTNQITFGINSTIKARIFPPAGTNLLPSAVIARNFIFLDTTATNFTSRLPTLIISTEGRPIPQNVPPGTPRTKGSLVVIDTAQGRSSIQNHPDIHELAEFEIFGQTSAGFPKLPIRIEIQDSLGNDLSKSLLGMPADADWRLRNPYNDKTLMNDFLGFELWEKMGHYSVRRKLVEVFVDTGGGRVVYPTDYYGVMVLTETIKATKERLNIPSLSPYATNAPAITGGYVFARDKDSAGDLNFSSPGGLGFAGIPVHLHEPKPNSLRYAQGVTTSYPGAGYTPSGTNQMNYLRNFLGDMERALYTNNWLTLTGTSHYSSFLDVERFADQMLHVELTKQIDGYRLSDYFSKDRLGKLGPGPVWDWNLAYGNADYLRGGQTNGWYYEDLGEQDHPWVRRLITGSPSGTSSTGDPNFVQLVADRWAMFRTGPLNATNTLQEIDELASLLSEAAARDLYGKYRAGLIGVYTWPNPGLSPVDHCDYVHPTNYAGAIETVYPATATNSIIGQMKKWVLGRYLWMDSQFTPVPTLTAPGGLVTNGFAVTVVPPAGSTLYYTLNGTDPRASGGTVIAGALSNNGPVTLTINANVRIVARAKAAGAFKNTFSGPNAVSLYTILPPLRITEIMYHPLPPPLGSLFSTEEFEYIEVKNIGNSPLNVSGFSLSGGVQFQFPNVMLDPGSNAVVVANIAAFQSRYTNFTGLILGAYTGNLNNSGDHVVLSGNLQEAILDFSYQDNWQPATDGSGFSLVTVDENAPTSAWGQPGNWRASSAVGGSPGQNDPAPPPRPPVLVNEVLTHAAPLDVDKIELHNPSASPVDIGGWFLTDDFQTPKKFVIPPTMIPAGGFVVFTETDFNNTNSPNDLKAFALSARGEQVYLFSGNGVDLTGYAHGFDFGAQAVGVTFGRYIISTGADHFVAQKTNTLGATNAGPLVGPMVISEINYHPADVAQGGIGYNNVADEFIELQNISSNAVPLYDVSFATNTWRLSDAVDYSFPSGVMVPPGGYLLVVNFDPSNPALLAAFRARNFVPDTLPVYGPWFGGLDNKSDRVELRRPDVPETNGAVSYILVERVAYSSEAPWPAAADGLGLSLQRINPDAYGNDPANWAASAPTSGGSFAGGTPPAITSQPGNLTALVSSDVIVSATATGTPPLRYQWRYSGLNIPNATNSTLTLSSVQFAQAGTYSVFVYNGGGYALGTNFLLTVRQGLKINTHPTNRIAQIGQTTNFTVAAIGTGILRYQWRFNGGTILNATNPILTISSIQTTNEGTYATVVTDDFDTLLSQTASLTLVYKPAITQHPQGITLLQGQNFSLSAAATGTVPLSFRWRKNPGGITLTNRILMVSNDTYTVSNINFADAGTYTVAITNIAGAALLSSAAVLTVLADFDRDGIADDWERLYGFMTNNLADASADPDHDGMSNYQEYLAGTNPTNGLSYLKIDSIVLNAASTNTLLTVSAVSNHTYSIICRDNVAAGPWVRLADIDARTTNRLVTVTNALPVGVTNRFYRLQTPKFP